MDGIRGRLSYANVVSTLCLFFVVAGGAAYAADTIGSSDIINNQVFSADVRDDTLTSGGLAAVDLRSGSVRASEVANGSLTGAEIATDGLTGSDIDESTLATVPSASLLDGLDSTRFKNTANVGVSSACNPLSSTVTTCASTTLTGLTSADDVYVSARWRWYGDAVGEDTGLCAIKRGSTEFDGGLFGQNGNEHDKNDSSAYGSLIGLDTNAPAGNATYSLRCFEKNGAVNMVSARIVAVRLSG